MSALARQTTATSVRQASTYVHAEDRHVFSEMGNKTFAFDHELGSSALVRLDALRDLCKYMEQQQLSYHFECAKGGPDSGWGSQPKEATLLGTFDGIASGNALILLKSVHRHPDYDRLLTSFLKNLGDVLGIDIPKHYEVPICTIILASPKRVTPYHMDDSHNFLMQVEGQKTFHVFDGTDIDIVSDQEREAFWSGDHSAAILTEAKQRKAITYDLIGGSGVHVPMTYPHWAQNGSDVSVAVSINFRPKHHRTSEIHGMNNLLRRRGLQPRAPGQNRMVDGFKVAAFRTLSTLKRIKDQQRRWSH